MANGSEHEAALTAEEWLSLVVDAERRGELLMAYDLSQRALENHPNDVLLKHRAVLALARSGAADQARALFQAYGLGDQEEEDIAALDARLAKDCDLTAVEPERTSHASVTSHAYRAIYERTGGYYPGINAATMLLVAHRPRESAELARRVIESCAEVDRKQGHEDYYLAATRAEASLLLDDLVAASEALARAATLHGGDYGAIATTRKQLRLICDIKGIDLGMLAPLSTPSVIHYVGHMIPATGESGRFAAEREDEIAPRIAATLAERDVGFGYGSLACGADIMFAEALLARGAELNVVLPFDKEEFIATSVARGGEDWLARFDNCMDQASSLTYATEDNYLGDDELFTYGARLAMGLALLRATYLDTLVEQIAVWDRKPPQGGAGTAVDVAYWRGRDLHTEVIDWGVPGDVSIGSVLSTATKQSGLGRVVRAMLFGDIKGFSKLREEELPRFVDEVMGRFAEVLRRYGKQVLYRNTWGDAIYVVLPDAATATRCALDLQQSLDQLDLAGVSLPDYLALRLGGHIGPVFEGRDPVLNGPAFFGAHVSRTARIEPVTPPGKFYVTEPFAAALALNRDAQFNCEYVGHMDAAKGYGVMRMYVVKRRMPH